MSVLKRIVVRLKNAGIVDSLFDLYRVVIKFNLLNYGAIRDEFKDKRILEVGGPSSIFTDSGIIPIYSLSNNIEFCNYSSDNIWNAHNETGVLGATLICEASNLSSICNKYDVVISSHMLEHCANPIKVILEMKKIINPGGYILFVVPGNKNCLDRFRHVTDFSHILKDYEDDVSEGDLTHLEEVIMKHNYAEDYALLSKEDFREKCLENIKYRIMHHHVFNSKLLTEISEYCQLKVKFCESDRDKNIILLCGI